MLVAIEDRNFYKHSGVDWKATARAFFSQCRKIPLLKNISSIKKIPYSGGSSIAQQLFRTLFIKHIDKKKVRRKIAEIILTRFWFNKTLRKNEQLEIYLSAVRFDNNVFGVLSAMKYYRGQIITIPTKAQSFFLIERVSIVSKKMFPKIIDIIVRLQKENKLHTNDIKEIIGHYEIMLKEQKIISDKNSSEILDRLTQIAKET